jgi:VanZ family protein
MTGTAASPSQINWAAAIQAVDCQRGPRAAMLSRMPSSERVARLLLLGGWMVLISYWSSQADLPIDQPLVANLLHGSQHKLAHVLAFGFLGLLGRWAFDGVPHSSVWAVLLVAAFGATDEWHQSFTLGRSPGIDDWAVDTTSAALAIYAWSRVRTTSWQRTVRAVAPLAVTAMFVLGLGLALHPNLERPANLNRATLRNVTSQVTHSVFDFARSTRDVARQMRSAATG